MLTLEELAVGIVYIDLKTLRGNLLEAIEA